MSTPHPPPETYTNIVHEAELDGGWSGQLRVLVASSNSDEQLVFVDSDLLGARRLVLTPMETLAVAEALEAAASEAIPPHVWNLASFESVFGYPPPAEHARTLADLKRHVEALSGRRQAERKRAHPARSLVRVLRDAFKSATHTDEGMCAPKTVHHWEVDVMPDEQAPLVLWADGRYVAHLDRAEAERLGYLLHSHAEEPL